MLSLHKTCSSAQFLVPWVIFGLTGYRNRFSALRDLPLTAWAHVMAQIVVFTHLHTCEYTNSLCVHVCRAAMFPAGNSNSESRHFPWSIHTPIYYPFCVRVHLPVHFLLAGVSAHTYRVFLFIVSPTTTVLSDRAPASAGTQHVVAGNHRTQEKHNKWYSATPSLCIRGHPAISFLWVRLNTCIHPCVIGSSYWSPVSVRVCLSVRAIICSLCLLCIFVVPVYSRLCSLHGTAFSVHCIHQRRDVLKDLALLTLQNTVVRKHQFILQFEPGR